MSVCKLLCINQPRCMAVRFILPVFFATHFCAHAARLNLPVSDLTAITSEVAHSEVANEGNDDVPVNKLGRAVGHSLEKIEKSSQYSFFQAKQRLLATVSQLSAEGVTVSSAWLAIVIVMFIVMSIPCLILLLSVSKQESSTDGPEDLEILAVRLRRYVRKYPLGRSRKFHGAKERYIAVLPAEDESIGYEGGRLAWWDDLNSFNQSEQAKGDVLITAIVSVEGGLIEKYSHCEVTVSFLESKSEVSRLVFLMSSKNEAKQWASDCNSLLQQVQRQGGRKTAILDDDRKSFSTSTSFLARLTRISGVGHTRSNDRPLSDDESDA